MFLIWLIIIAKIIGAGNPTTIEVRAITNVFRSVGINIELSKYCRTNGYYVEDVKAWRNSCIVANDRQKEDSIELREELTKEKKKAKELEREIRIKDKALAETTALLVLKKKLNAIFGDLEED